MQCVPLEAVARVRRCCTPRLAARGRGGVAGRRSDTDTRLTLDNAARPTPTAGLLADETHAGGEGYVCVSDWWMVTGGD